MIMKFLKLPLGVVQILSVNEYTQFPTNDYLEHRPDKVLELIGASSTTQELINNHMSITSPISMVTGSPYKVMNDFFMVNYKGI